MSGFEATALPTEPQPLPSVLIIVLVLIPAQSSVVFCQQLKCQNSQQPQYDIPHTTILCLSDQDPAPKDLILYGLSQPECQPIHPYGSKCFRYYNIQNMWAFIFVNKNVLFQPKTEVFKILISYMLKMISFIFISKSILTLLVKLPTSGQSYKQFMLVIYNSTVAIWGIFKSGMTLES